MLTTLWLLFQQINLMSLNSTQLCINSTDACSGWSRSPFDGFSSINTQQQTQQNSTDPVIRRFLQLARYFNNFVVPHSERIWRHYVGYQKTSRNVKSGDHRGHSIVPYRQIIWYHSTPHRLRTIFNQIQLMLVTQRPL